MKARRSRKYPDLEEWARAIMIIKARWGKKGPPMATRFALNVAVSYGMLPAEAELVPIGTLNRELRKICGASVKRKTTKREFVPIGPRVIQLPIKTTAEGGGATQPSESGAGSPCPPVPVSP